MGKGFESQSKLPGAVSCTSSQTGAYIYFLRVAEKMQATSLTACQSRYLKRCRDFCFSSDIPYRAIYKKQNQVRTLSDLVLFFKFHYIVCCAANDSAKFFQGVHGDIFILLQRVQRLVVDTAFYKLILADVAFFHCLPQWFIAYNWYHRLT